VLKIWNTQKPFQPWTARTKVKSPCEGEVAHKFGRNGNDQQPTTERLSDDTSARSHSEEKQTKKVFPTQFGVALNLTITREEEIRVQLVALVEFRVNQARRKKNFCFTAS
jgi:hypothetical protein